MTGYIGINSKAQKIKNVYFGLNNVALKVKKAYIGVNGVAQLWYSSQREWVWDVYRVDTGYNPIEGSSISYTQSSAFYVDTNYTLNQSTGQFSADCTTQIARNSTGATNAIGKYFITDENDYPPTASSTYVGDKVYLITNASYNWLNGLSLTLTPITSEYYENYLPTGSISSFDVTAYPTNGIQDGYLYVLQNEVAQIEVTYSGTWYDDGIKIMNEVPYRVLRLTTSGTLSLSSTVKADVWICGGGGAGQRGYYGGNSSSESTAYNARSGGGGAYAAEADAVNIKNLTVTIGSGGSTNGNTGGDSTIAGDISLVAYGGNKDTSGKLYRPYGGSGGGGGQSRRGLGDGARKDPFGIDYYYPMCDGGGGGGYYYNATTLSRRSGGAGGTNGSNGNAQTDNGANSGGAGGGQYGGSGRASSSSSGSANNGYAATGPGSGGGGGAYYFRRGNSSDTEYYGSGGAGYQGRCYIRLPL